MACCLSVRLRRDQIDVEEARSRHTPAISHAQRRHQLQHRPSKLAVHGDADFGPAAMSGRTSTSTR
jgi:hypothetical protein